MRGVVVALLLATSPAFADETPPDYQLARLIIGAGASGFTGDHQATFGLRLRFSKPIAQYVSIGGYAGVGARAWRAVPRLYRSLDDCDPKDGECLAKDIFGYPFGWVVAFGAFEAGWDLMLHRGRGETPWLSFGTTILVLSDNGEAGATNGETTRYVVGHAGNLGVGYDFGSVGLGVRATVARDFAIFAAGGSANAAYSVQATIEVPFYGRY